MGLFEKNLVRTVMFKEMKLFCSYFENEDVSELNLLLKKFFALGLYFK